MLANAIATKLKRKLLLVNFPDFGTNSSGAIIKVRVILVTCGDDIQCISYMYV